MAVAAVTLVVAGGEKPALSADSVLQFVNRDRERDGLRALRVAAPLARAAQRKADDMAEKRYFSHTSPDGRTAWDFMTAEKYKYADAGENLATGRETAEAVQRAWMNSPGHRANILSRAFTETGIGIARGERGYLVVQMFGKPR